MLFLKQDGIILAADRLANTSRYLRLDLDLRQKTLELDLALATQRHGLDLDLSPQRLGLDSNLQQKTYFHPWYTHTMLISLLGNTKKDTTHNITNLTQSPSAQVTVHTQSLELCGTHTHTHNKPHTEHQYF